MWRWRPGRCSCGPGPPGRSIRPSCNGRCRSRLGVEWGPDRSNTREHRRVHRRASCGRSRNAPWRSKPNWKRWAPSTSRRRCGCGPTTRRRSPPARPRTTRSPRACWSGRWQSEAATVGLAVGPGARPAGVLARPDRGRRRFEEIVRVLVDEDTGLCAHSPRFAEPDVIEHIAALSAGRLTARRDPGDADRVPGVRPRRPARPARRRRAGNRPAGRPPPTAPSKTTPSTCSTGSSPGRAPRSPDTIVAVVGVRRVPRCRPTPAPCRVLCGPGGAVRAVLAPAGHGKTAMVHAAARPPSPTAAP